MTIRYFSDEDREKMRQEKELAQLYAEFEREYFRPRMRRAARDQPVPEKIVEGFEIRPWPRKS